MERHSNYDMLKVLYYRAFAIIKTQPKTQIEIGGNVMNIKEHGRMHGVS